jgi:predicted transcriptional regulator
MSREDLISYEVSFRVVFSTDRRNSTEIVYELLALSKRGVSKSQMVHEANLNFRLATRYTMQLGQMGLIGKNASSQLAEKYYLTRKGEKVLKILSQLRSELDLDRSPIEIVPFPSQDIEPEPSRPKEPRDYSRTSREQENSVWFDRVKPFVSYVLMVLAGMGLGYLLP